MDGGEHHRQGDTMHLDLFELAVVVVVFILIAPGGSMVARLVL
jgi:hypothetical protein